MPPTLWLIGLVIIVVYFISNYKKKKVYEAGEKFPGPKAYPLLGNSLDFASNSKGKKKTLLFTPPSRQLRQILFTGIFQTLVRFSNKYDRFYRLWNNGQLFVMSKDCRDSEVSGFVVKLGLGRLQWLSALMFLGCFKQ